jgi:hypothetical protein
LGRIGKPLKISRAARLLGIKSSEVSCAGSESFIEGYIRLRQQNLSGKSRSDIQGRFSNRFVKLLRRF